MRDARVSVFAAVVLCLSTGCGSTILTYTSTGTKTVYVVQNSSTESSLLGFAATAGASATPTLVLNAPAGEQFGPQAVDAAGNLYLAVEAPTPAILVYAADSSGAAAPVRTITTSTMGPPTISVTLALAVDSSGQIYVGSINSVTVFAANANGPAVPARVISGASTMLTNPVSMALDGSGNLYVINLSSAPEILVFAPTATGNTAPARAISSSSLTRSYGVAVDGDGDIYATNDVPPASAILEFAAGANGTATPIRTLTAVSSLAIGGVAADSQGTIYAVTVPPGVVGGAAPGTPGVTIFSSNASGSTPPLATISSSVWTASTWGQIAIH